MLKLSTPVHAPKHWKDYIVLFLGLLAVLGYFRIEPCIDLWNLPAPYSSRIESVAEMADVVRYTPLIYGLDYLFGEHQDMAGFQGLWDNSNPYPPLTVFGRHGNTTHPPTGYLFAAPIAFLPIYVAMQVWLVICVGLMVIAGLCYGLRWPLAVGLALCLPILCGPICDALRFDTLFWLAGVAVAYRYMVRRPLLAGAGIGAAALTKLLPLGMTGYFVFKRQFKSALGVLLVWACAVAVVLFLCPHAFAAYAAVNWRGGNNWANIIRTDNISPFGQAYNAFGFTGLLGVFAFLGVVIWKNARALFVPNETPAFSFFLYSYLAVLLLPICWTFSLPPLLPALGYFLVKGNWPQRVVVCGVLLAMSLSATYAHPSLYSALLLIAGAPFMVSTHTEKSLPFRPRLQTSFA
jgi:hypothetical protein